MTTWFYLKNIELKDKIVKKHFIRRGKSVFRIDGITPSEEAEIVKPYLNMIESMELVVEITGWQWILPISERGWLKLLIRARLIEVDKIMSVAYRRQGAIFILENVVATRLGEKDYHYGGILFPKTLRV